jgi:hypothetical protein
MCFTGSGIKRENMQTKNPLFFQTMLLLLLLLFWTHHFGNWCCAVEEIPAENITKKQIL